MRPFQLKNKVWLDLDHVVAIGPPTFDGVDMVCEFAVALMFRETPLLLRFRHEELGEAPMGLVPEGVATYWPILKDFEKRMMQAIGAHHEELITIWKS